MPLYRFLVSVTLCLVGQWCITSPVSAAPCAVTTADELLDTLASLDDGLGGTTGDCLNAAGWHEIALSGTLALDAPLVVDLGDGLDLHGPAEIVPSLQYELCSATECPACAITLLQWDHRLHDLTISGFPQGGICTAGAGHQIHHVTVHDIVGDGIRLEGENNTAIWNAVQGTHGDGIALYSVTNLALQNTIGGYDHYGIAFYGTGFLPELVAAILASNTILPGADDGQCSNVEPCSVQSVSTASIWNRRAFATERIPAATPDIPSELPTMIPEDLPVPPLPEETPPSPEQRAVPATLPAANEPALPDRLDQPPGGCSLILQ